LKSIFLFLMLLPQFIFGDCSGQFGSPHLQYQNSTNLQQNQLQVVLIGGTQRHNPAHLTASFWNNISLMHRAFQHRGTSAIYTHLNTWDNTPQTHSVRSTLNHVSQDLDCDSETDTTGPATIESINSTLTTLCENSQPQVLLYITAHGLTEDQGQIDLNAFPQSRRQRNRQSENSTPNFLDRQQIASWITQLQSCHKEVALVFDSCYSGQWQSLSEEFPVCLISSSQNDEVSYMSGGLVNPYGKFTERIGNLLFHTSHQTNLLELFSNALGSIHNPIGEGSRLQHPLISQDSDQTHRYYFILHLLSLLNSTDSTRCEDQNSLFSLALSSFQNYLQQWLTHNPLLCERFLL
jgi:hypothetical protein